MTDKDTDRTELLGKLRSRMNQRKMGRMNKTHKERTMNQMKEKIVGDNEQMSAVFDKMVTKTKKSAKKNKMASNLSNQDALQKELAKNLNIE
jgi:hypothetical protein